MYIPNIRYIKGAPKSYPLWDAITPDAERRIKGYHSYLEENGYKVKAVNIAQKAGSGGRQPAGNGVPRGYTADDNGFV